MATMRLVFYREVKKFYPQAQEARCEEFILCKTDLHPVAVL